MRAQIPNPDGWAGAIANEVLSKASQDRGRIWRRAHRTRPAQVLSRRSLAGALRRGFVSRLRAEVPPRTPPAGPRSITGPVTRLSPTTPTPPDRKALTCYNAHTMDWRRRPWTVPTTCAMWCRETAPGSGLVGVPARQSGIAASRSCLRSRVHTFICHDLSHAPCETSPCLRRGKQVRHVRLHVPLLRRLHVRVPGPPGEQVIRHPVVGEVREARRPSIVQTDPAEAVCVHCSAGPRSRLPAVRRGPEVAAAQSILARKPPRRGGRLRTHKGRQAAFGLEWPTGPAKVPLCGLQPPVGTPVGLEVSTVEDSSPSTTTGRGAGLVQRRVEALRHRRGPRCRPSSRQLDPGAGARPAGRVPGLHA